MKTRAFTLLEILIVIVIIALLAALLFPVFGRVREVGRRTTCASNLKQISLAFNQYAQDYKFYPVLSDDVNMPDAPAVFRTSCGAWPDKMLPYVKENSILCAHPTSIIATLLAVHRMTHPVPTSLWTTEAPTRSTLLRQVFISTQLLRNLWGVIVLMAQAQYAIPVLQAQS